MTLSVSKKISYFARASFYRTDKNDNIISFKKIRVVSIVLECPPLRCGDDVDRYIYPELRGACNEKDVFCDIDLISPVCWPNMLPSEQINEEDADVFDKIIFCTSGKGKTGNTPSVMEAIFNEVAPESTLNYLRQLGALPCREYTPIEKQAIVSAYRQHFVAFRGSKAFRKMIRKCRKDNSLPPPMLSPEYISELAKVLEKALGNI